VPWRIRETVLPDDSPAHPYDVAMETAMLAPNAEMSLFPWKEPKVRIPWRCATHPFVPQGASSRLVAGGDQASPRIGIHYGVFEE